MKRAGLLVFVWGAVAAGCARGDTRPNDPLVSDAGPPPAPPPPAFIEAGTTPAANPVECAEETQQIYVLGSDKVLYRFYPADLKFVRVGTLACPTSEGTFSMAVDRRGVAWVEYLDGRVYQVDTYDASCKPTPFKAGQTGFDTFGMGFALNSDDPKDGETLYVAGDALAALDTKTFELGFRGSLTFSRNELTGLGSQLYAFSVESGVVARLNKATAAPEVTYRSTAIDGRAAFAFAQWGGKFWLFTGRPPSSTVTTYAPDTDTSTVVVQSTGMLIVGAGSSTCAPIRPPG